MIYWGLTYEEFNNQPISLIHRLFMLNQIKPFLPSGSWVQAGTIAAATYNVHAGRKNKMMAYDDIFPFLKEEREVNIMEGHDTESQLELHRKLGAILG